jgi:hypothetical protein
MVVSEGVVNISLSALKSGYAYFFSASGLNTTGQKEILEFVYMHSEKSLDL